MYLVLDVETNGLVVCKEFNKYYDYKELKYYKNSRIVSIAWQLMQNNKTIITTNYFIIKPNNFTIDEKSKSFEINKISKMMVKNGRNLDIVLNNFLEDLNKCEIIIAHNLNFDKNILLAEAYRLKKNILIDKLLKKKSYCTMEQGKNITKIENAYGYKYPKLTELYNHFFKKSFKAHNALNDVKATCKCFFKMK